MKTTPIITVSSNETQVSVNSTFILTCKSTSNAPILLSSATPHICQVNTNFVSVLQPGSGIINVFQAASAEYAATTIQYKFEALKNSQKIDFYDTPNISVAEYCFINARTHSNLPITFKLLTSNLAVLNNNHLKAMSSGMCIVEASQPGNSLWAPAPTVQLSFFIKP